MFVGASWESLISVPRERGASNGDTHAVHQESLKSVGEPSRIVFASSAE